MESEVLKQVASYGVFAVLFFYLLYDSRKEHKADKKAAADREILLMDHISKSDKCLENIADKQAEMTTTLSDIQQNQILMQKLEF